SYFGSSLEDLQRALRSLPRLPLEPLGWLVANRVLQVTELGVAMAAVGIHAPPSLAFIAEALVILGASAGDLVPGQIGATEAALAAAAPWLGGDRAAIIVVALLLHLAQTCWVVVGFALPLFRVRSGSSWPRLAPAPVGGSTPGTGGPRAAPES